MNLNVFLTVVDQKCVSEFNFMPNGPQGQKRPADVIARAVMVSRIATGEIEDIKPYPVSPKGASGGKARSVRLSPSRRSEIAKMAATAQWAEKEGVT